MNIVGDQSGKATVPALRMNLNQNSSKNLLVGYEVATVRDYALNRYKNEGSTFQKVANDFVLPPSGRLTLNSGGQNSLDVQIRGMRPPGYRGGQGGTAFNALSAANISQETGFGHLTQIGSNLNFGVHPIDGDRENHKASVDIKELNALLNLDDMDCGENFERKTGRSNF